MGTAVPVGGVRGEHHASIAVCGCGPDSFVVAVWYLPMAVVCATVSHRWKLFL